MQTSEHIHTLPDLDTRSAQLTFTAVQRHINPGPIVTQNRIEALLWLNTGAVLLAFVQTPLTTSSASSQAASGPGDSHAVNTSQPNDTHTAVHSQ